MPAFADDIFYFSGVCEDCTGTVFGTLVLTDNGQAGISFSDFVSFTYNGSNLWPGGYTITDPSFVSGTIPAVLPGPASVDIEEGELYFYSIGSTGGNSSGQWATGINNIPSDFGYPHQYSTTNPSSAPEPTTWAMLGSALVGLIYFRRRLFNALR